MNQNFQQHLKQSLGTANTLLQQGRLDEAKALLTQILIQAPNLAQATFLLAMVAVNQQRLTEAIDLFNKVLKQLPRNASVIGNLASLYTQTGQCAKAIKHYEKLIKLGGAEASSYYHLASNHKMLGETTKAIKVLRDGIKRHSSDETLYSLLATTYYELNDYLNARIIYQNSYDKGFRSDNLFVNLAKMHVILGETDQAKRTLIAAIECFPATLSFHYQLSRFSKEFLDVEFEDQLKQGLANGSINGENAFYANFLLALIAKRDRHCQDEITFLKAGHQIYKEQGSFRYISDFYLKHLPKLALERTSEHLELLRPDATLSLMQPIFLVGVPRSGSTLMEAVIASGSTPLQRTEESGVMLHAANFLEFSTPDVFWRDYVSKVRAGLRNFQVTKKDTRFTDKSLDNFFLIDVILRVFPRAKIIWSQRTPLASLVSILQNNMFFLPWAHEVDQIIEYFQLCHQLMDRWLSQYPDQIRIQSYEKFVHDPVAQSQALLEFCELSWDESCLEFYQKKHSSRTASNIQIRKQINTQSAESFRQYVACFEKEIERHPWLID